MLKEARCTLRVVLTFIMISLTLVSCIIRPKEVDLTFQSIEQQASSGTGNLYKAKQPGLIVISSPDEVDGLDGLITDDAKQSLLVLDYNAYFALAAFQGWKPSSGFGVLVNRITQEGNTVNVYAQFSEPRPDEEKADIVTSPYHLIIVQKDGSWGKEILFNLVSKDIIVDSVSHNIP